MLRRRLQLALALSFLVPGSLDALPAARAGAVTYTGYGAGTGDYEAPHNPPPVRPLSGPATVSVAYGYDPSLPGIPMAGGGTIYNLRSLSIVITIPYGGRDWTWEQSLLNFGSIAIDGDSITFRVDGNDPPNGWITEVQLHERDNFLPPDQLPSSLAALADAYGTFESRDQYGSTVQGTITSGASPSSVPEPSSLGMAVMGLALLGIALVVRRRL